MATLKEKFQSKMLPMRDRIKQIRKENGDIKIGECTIEQAYGGMRSVKCMVWEVSALDPMEGIRFRGYTIPELQQKLPKAPGGGEPLPEGIFHLLLTGEIPTYEDCQAITEDWRRRSQLPKYLVDVLKAIPADTHPMTQFSLAILQLQKESLFAAKYREGMNKLDYWDPMYEDSMNILAKLPGIAAYIYRKSYKKDKHIPADPKLDWGANLAHMLGVSDEPAFLDLLRLYLVIHCDHEGGNVSAHTCHLVGSALSDAYYSLSAAMDGLAGPLHGLANQEVLRWLMDLMKDLGGVPTREQLEKYMWDTLNAGKVVPGYGHAVLRITDPRFDAFLAFGKKYCKGDPAFETVARVFDVVPNVLKEVQKIKDPWPNVDAGSGALLYHYGLKEFSYYTVLFAVSRALGVCAQAVMARGLGLPITRPKSVPTTWMKKEVTK